jgi:hypothetical protein
LPDDAKTRHERILDIHTGLVDVRRIKETNTGPVVNLAIIDSDGGGSPIGRGLYVVPPQLFESGD